MRSLDIIIEEVSGTIAKVKIYGEVHGKISSRIP